MDSTKKQILNAVLDEARAEMEHGAVRDIKRAYIIGNKLVQAAFWETMDEAEIACYAEAVVDFAYWVKPSCCVLSDFIINNMAVRCVRSRPARSKRAGTAPPFEAV